MHRSYHMFLPGLLLLVAGCATVGNRVPDWVRNPKTTYPEKTFLVAVGEGDTRQGAENAAAANLSRIFEAHIESDERVIDTVKETNKDFIRSTDMTTDINILSSQTLINIQHAEAWKDAAGRYHAVAYLKRRDTARIYLDKANEKSVQVESLITRAQQTENTVTKYAMLRAAARGAVENDLILRQLKVIHPPTASAAAPDYTLHELQQAASNSAKQIRVGIQIQGDDDGRMKNCLQELVTSYGFVVGAPSVLEIAGRVAITDTGIRTAGLAFFTYELSIQIKDAGGTILATINENGREAVSSADRARERCCRTMEQTVRSKGTRNLDAYFDSLVEQAK